MPNHWEEHAVREFRVQNNDIYIKTQSLFIAAIVIFTLGMNEKVHTMKFH